MAIRLDLLELCPLYCLFRDLRSICCILNEKYFFDNFECLCSCDYAMTADRRYQSRLTAVEVPNELLNDRDSEEKDLN